MKSAKRLFVLGGLLLAMMIGTQAGAWANNPSRTVSEEWQRIRIQWRYSQANGDTVFTEVHRCDTRRLDSMAGRKAGSSQVDEHVCIYTEVRAIGGELLRRMRCEMPSSPYALGTELKSERIRVTGSGVGLEYTNGVPAEKTFSFDVDLLVHGAGPVTAEEAEWEWVDSTGLTWLSEMTRYTRAGTCSGLATLDSEPMAPADCEPVVEMLHSDTTSVPLM